MQPSFLSGYFGRPIHDLYHLFMGQLEVLYQDFGLNIPVVCSSTLQLIHSKSRMAPADIARALGDPHQVVAQRLGSLEKRGLISKSADKTDKRRSVIMLTPEGVQQAERLEYLMKVSEGVYAELMQEIGVNLPALLARTKDALLATDMRTRMLSVDPDLARHAVTAPTLEAMK